jgi:hypothetical protein
MRVMMKPFFRILICLSISTAALAQSPSDRPELMRLPPDAQSVVTTWLNQECGVEELKGLQNRLQQIGLILEPVLWEAYRLGPTDLDRNTFLDQTRQRYRERQAHLEAFGERLFGKDEATQLQQTPEEQFVQRHIDDYVNRYRTAALAGIGVVGTKTSDLQAIAEDAKNPAQGAAKEALRSIEQRTKR